MLAPELRIGNLVKYLTGGYGDEPCQGRVTSINEYGASLNGSTMVIMYRDLLPIPLSQEWLEKFGFQKNKYGNYFIYIKDMVNEDKTLIVCPSANIYADHRQNDLGYGVGIQNSILDSVALGIYKHVHSLQNLFYALTGTELTM